MECDYSCRHGLRIDLGVLRLGWYTSWFIDCHLLPSVHPLHVVLLCCVCLQYSLLYIKAYVCIDGSLHGAETQ